MVDALLSEFILDARKKKASAIDLGYVGPPNLLTGRLRAFGFLQRTAQNGLLVYVGRRGAVRRGSREGRELVLHDRRHGLLGVR